MSARPGEPDPAGSGQQAQQLRQQHVVIAGTYLIEEKIGRGAYGDVFRARDVNTGEKVAVKREPEKQSGQNLDWEVQVYREVAGSEGFLRVNWVGHEERYRVMVMPLLGRDLEQIKQEAVETGNGVPLSLITAIGVALTTRLETLHSLGFVYRDMKPGNVMFPVGFEIPKPDFDTGLDIREEYNKIFYDDFRQSQAPSWPALKVFLIDLGLVKSYIDPTTRRHIRTTQAAKQRIGTARYASLNVHKGKGTPFSRVFLVSFAYGLVPHHKLNIGNLENTRRDDIESLAYVLLELLRGSLPWSNQKARGAHAGWNRMREAKRDVDLYEVYEGCPMAFFKMLDYAREMRFEETPDYEKIRTMLRNVGDPSSEDAQPVTLEPFIGTAPPATAEEMKFYGI